MEDKKFHLKIITPERIVFEDDVQAITAHGAKGAFQVLYNHTPFMTTLTIDTAKVKKDDETFIFSIIGGVFQFKNNEAIVLSKVAELGSDIDTAKAKKAKEDAELALTIAKNENDIKKANQAIAKAMARLKAAAKK